MSAASSRDDGHAASGKPAIRHRNALASAQYQRFIVGSICYFCSWWLQRVTIAWTIWKMSNSPIWLGALGATEVVPIILLGAFSGAVLDRIPRMDVLRASQVAAVTTSISLAFLSSADLLSVPIALLIFFIRGAVNTVYLPAAMALAPLLIEKDQLNSAISVNSIVINLSMTLGPGAAGLLLLYASPPLAYICSALLNAAYLLLLFTISGRDAPPRAGKSLLAEAYAGLVYAIRHRMIRAALVIFFAASFCIRSMIDLLSGYSGILPHGGPQALSILSSALGVGALAGSAWMSWTSSTRDIDVRTYITRGFVAMTFAGAAFSLSDNLVTAACAVFIMGFTIALNGIGTQTVIQHEVDEAFRGRLMAIYSIIFRGAWGLGAIVISAAANEIGLRLAGAAAAVLCLLMFAALVAREGQALPGEPRH